MTNNILMLARSENNKRRGLEVLGIDHMLRPRQVKAPAVRVDISDPAQQHVIMQMVRRAHCVFLAPPCGTSSRARSIPLAGRGPKPRPLRSPAFPEGLRKLTGVAAARVASANRLYRFAADIFAFCSKAARFASLRTRPTLLCGTLGGFVLSCTWATGIVIMLACMVRLEIRRLLSSAHIPCLPCSFFVTVSILTCPGAAARIVILGPSPLLPKLSTPRASVLPWPRISATL